MATKGRPGNSGLNITGMALSIQNLLRDALRREGLQSAATMSFKVTILQAAHQHGINRRPGNHAQLTCLRNCFCQTPVRNRDPHATLNYYRMIVLHPSNLLAPELSRNKK